MAIIQFHDVYVTSRSAVGGPVEAKGPLAEQFDKCYEDTYCGEDCFEKAERRLLYDASDIALRKAQLQVSDLDVLVGGDLLNQLMSSHYFAKIFMYLLLVCMQHVLQVHWSLHCGHVDRTSYGISCNGFYQLTYSCSRTSISLS